MGYQTFAEAMFLIRIVEPYSILIMEKEDLDRNFPDFKTRLDTLARDYTIKMFGDSLPKDISTGEYSRKLMDFWYSDDFANAKKQNREDFKTKLKEQLEFRDINGGRE